MVHINHSVTELLKVYLMDKGLSHNQFFTFDVKKGIEIMSKIDLFSLFISANGIAFFRWGLLFGKSMLTGCFRKPKGR